MKILRLTLHNLASLAGTHTIDFEREPLRSTGLFAISGATGSGKSTLLDGLCLAFYENTPRLTAASGTKLPDVSGEELTQKAPANLLRRGAAEGFSEVAFAGVDGQTYTARWSVRRAHQRFDGALQKTEVALYRGNVRDGRGSLVEGVRTKAEVLDAIAKKIGLSFEQFTRAVLLAQNEFGAFLKSDDKQRAEILQALTGTERFQRISIAVFEREKKERSEIEALEATAKGQLPLRPELRAEADAALQDAAAGVDAAKTGLATREAHLAWFKRSHDLTAQLQTAQATLARATQAVSDSAARRTELREAEELSSEARSMHDAENVASAQQAAAIRAVTDAKQRALEERAKAEVAHKAHAEQQTQEAQARLKLAAAAPELARARALDAQLEPATARRAEKQRERVAAEQQHQQQVNRAAELERALAAAKERRTALEQQRQPIAWVTPIVADVTAWSERLQTVIAARQDVATAQRELTAKQSAEEKSAAALDQARLQLKAAQTVLAQKDQARLTAEASTKLFDADAMAAERTRLDARLALVTEAHATAVELVELRRRTDAIDAEVRGLQQQTVTLTEEIKAHRAALPKGQARLEACRASRLLVEATIAEQTALLREKLRPTEPCPVCGATDHPYAAQAPVVDAALAGLRQNEQDAERSLLELRQQTAAAEARLGEIGKQQQAKAAEQRGTQDQLAPAAEKLAGAVVALALGSLPESETAAAIAQVHTEVDATRARLTDSERRHRDANKALSDATKACDAARDALTGATQVEATKETAFQTAKAQREAAEMSASRALKARDAAEAAVKELFVLLGQTAEAQFAADAKAFADELAAAGQLIRRIDDELAQLAAGTDRLVVEHGEVAKAVTALREAVDLRRSEERSAELAFDTLRKERASVLGGRAVEVVDRELNEATKTARVRLDAAAAKLAESNQAATAAAAAFAEAEKRAAAVAEELQRARAALDRWLSEYATRTSRSVDRSHLITVLRRGQPWIEAQRTELTALDKALSTAQGAVTAHDQQLTGHTNSRPTVEEEHVVVAALEVWRRKLVEAEEKRVSAAAVVSADNQRRKEHAALETKIAELRAKAEPWFKLNDLIGSADGAKFRGIVQGRTLDLLLRYANAQLELLSARYRLERQAGSLNLIIVDRDMADERRSVHTLSGGESFLVSLALALGLASLTSNRIRIESLFIDEGFGSLDPATLETAMNALMHLEAQGRKVGVISHVAEMADAIHVQIKVVKGASGASRIVVPGGAEAEQPPLVAPAPSGVTAPTAETVAKLLSILESSGRISKVALRRQIGCTLEELDLACESLGDRVQLEGRSLRLR